MAATRRSRKAAPARDIGNTGARTYGQCCPIAVGLDVVGDRWVLLICRELSFGDRRFTDLRANLPGIAPNLLSDRLRALRAAGLVTVAELPPPAARHVYRLTEAGERIRPVLAAVARFGAHHLGAVADGTLDASRAAAALLLPWVRWLDRDVRLRLELSPGDRADVVAAPGRVQVAPVDGAPDVVLRCRLGDLVTARRDDVALIGTLDGAPDDVELVRRAFQLRRITDPAPAGTLGR